MDLNQFLDLVPKSKSKSDKFMAVNFGCRVNSSELNQLSQLLVDQGFSPCPVKGRVGEGFVPSVILVNTCSITTKGEFESLAKVRHLNTTYPNATVLVTGCADPKRIEGLEKVHFFNNDIKEKVIAKYESEYSPAIEDKFSRTHRYLLRVQAGCSQFCSFCIVPYRRPHLWSLTIDKAIQAVNSALQNGYKEVIITGVNLEQYGPGLSNLVEALLEKTSIPLISFGSVAVNCIDDKFIKLVSSYSSRVSTFLHIPIQSGSTKILKLMKRPYNKEKLIDTFNKLKDISSPLSSKRGSRGDLFFGTDVIVGFPGETEQDFQDTYDLCKMVGFTKIHTFRYSPRDKTLGKFYYHKNHKLTKTVLHRRSLLIRSL